MNVATDGDAVRTTLGLTRPAHETLVRRLVAKQCDNVTFVSGTVLGVDPTVDRKTLEAVRYRPADDARKVNTVKAALVLGEHIYVCLLNTSTDVNPRLLRSGECWAWMAPTRRVPARKGRDSRELPPAHALHVLHVPRRPRRPGKD
jgi:hypothetical protein